MKPKVKIAPEAILEKLNINHKANHFKRSRMQAGNTLSDKVKEARERLAKKFGDVGTQLGGKGSERRKKKTTHKTQINDDKKLKAMIKKFNVHPLPEISEVNMFRDDNTVLQFREPEGIP